MAEFTFQLRRFGNTPVTIKAESREAAEARLRSASPEQLRGAAEQSLRARQRRTGISDEDISTILGGEGHRGRANTLRVPYTDLSVNVGDTAGEIAVGAGRSFDAAQRGIRQLAAPLTGEDPEQLARDEANNRETFNVLDSQGIGAEDLGQFIGDAAMFLGGGNAKIGWQLLNYGLRGAVFGGIQATTGDESAARNALIGGISGVAGTGTAYAIGKLLKVGGEGLFNLLGMLTAASQRNGMGLAISGSHFMQSISRGRTQAMRQIRAARQAGKPVDPPTAAALATTEQAMSQISRVVGRLTGSDRQKFLATTLRAVRDEGIENGVINPRTAWQRLEEFRPHELTNMGVIGEDILRIRNAFGLMAKLDNWKRQEVQQAMLGIINNPVETRSLTTALLRAGSPGGRAAIMRTLGRVAGTAPAASAQAPLQVVPQALIGQQYATN